MRAEPLHQQRIEDLSQGRLVKKMGNSRAVWPKYDEDRSDCTLQPTNLRGGEPRNATRQTDS